MKTFERRFLFVTGKGGVGKTTVSACLARTLSSRGRRVLLAATDPAGYGDLLPNALWLDDPQPCGERLFTVQLEPEAALREYGRLLIKPRLARQAVFENRFVQGFLKGLPGLPQWAVLGKAWYHTTEMVDGAPRFDSVVFDAPATGHAVELLRLPRVIAELAPAGLLRRDAELAWELLSDARQTCIALVTLPEELPSNETSELATRISNELGLPLGAVLLNRLRPLLFQADERNALAGLAKFDVSAPGGAALEAARLRAIAESVQLDSETRLAEVRAPLFQLPELETVNGEELLGALMRALQQASDV